VPQAEDAGDVDEATGGFRIHLGAVAGVGKTYTMLNERRRRAGLGPDMVVGFVEPQGRARGTGATERRPARAPQKGRVPGDLR
jgi:two-component system, OmpR family, sensor histidine kinase KdpD